MEIATAISLLAAHITGTVDASGSAAVVFDRRGKAMVKGGRYRTAQHVRFLRRNGAGNQAAWAYITSGRQAYASRAAA